MDDRVEALQFGGLDLADVARQRFDLSDLRAEVAAPVEERVEPDHVVPCVGEQGSYDRTDVPVAAGDKYAHRRHTLVREPHSCGS